MPSRFRCVIALFCFGVVVGCGSKPTSAECETACSNVAAVALKHIQHLRQDKALKSAGEAGQDLAVEMAKGMLEVIRGDCLKLCQVKLTRKKTTCLASAKTLAEISGCR